MTSQKTQRFNEEFPVLSETAQAFVNSFHGSGNAGELAEQFNSGLTALGISQPEINQAWADWLRNTRH